MPGGEGLNQTINKHVSSLKKYIHPNCAHTYFRNKPITIVFKSASCLQINNAFAGENSVIIFKIGNNKLCLWTVFSNCGLGFFLLYLPGYFFHDSQITH